jgi:hypothetical protein
VSYGCRKAREGQPASLGDRSPPWARPRPTGAGSPGQIDPAAGSEVDRAYAGWRSGVDHPRRTGTWRLQADGPWRAGAGSRRWGHVVRRREPRGRKRSDVTVGCADRPERRCSSGCRVPGAGCRVPGAGCRVPGAGLVASPAHQTGGIPRPATRPVSRPEASGPPPDRTGPATIHRPSQPLPAASRLAFTARQPPPAAHQPLPTTSRWHLAPGIRRPSPPGTLHPARPGTCRPAASHYALPAAGCQPPASGTRYPVPERGGRLVHQGPGRSVQASAVRPRRVFDGAAGAPCGRRSRGRPAFPAGGEAV